MRLLNTSSFELKHFIGGAVPHYAILSHTWGEEEVLFEDARSAKTLLACGKRGLQKILDSCERARRAGNQYIWVDTCCIDKSSSAELSEAINSMFAWYGGSKVCYAYLEDLSASDGVNWDDFARCRWLTRGWTLQELIAPDLVEFYDRDWNLIGARSTLAARLSLITGIGEQALLRHQDSPCRGVSEHLKSSYSPFCYECETPTSTESILQSFSIATRMSWAANRQTTRVEDIAYSLLGMFSVNMPLLYGEGDRAFVRLQEEIIKNSNDQSILAWKRSLFPGGDNHTALALMPSCFRSQFKLIPVLRLMDTFQIATTSKGLEVTVLLAPCKIHLGASGFQPAWLAALNCGFYDDARSRPAILLRKDEFRSNLFQRNLTCGSQIVALTPGSSEAKFLYATDFKRVTFEVSEFKTETILLGSYPDAFSRQRVPPVDVNLVDRSGTRFALHCSVPPITQPSASRNITSFWTSRSYRGIALLADLCGAYCFTERYEGFFVLLGLNQGRDYYVQSESEWWEDDEPYCSVHSWSSVAGRPYNSRDASLLTDEAFFSNFLEPLYSIVGTFGMNTQRVKNATCTTRLDSGRNVTATVQRAEFLAKKYIQLTVEVE